MSKGDAAPLVTSAFTARSTSQTKAAGAVAGLLMGKVFWPLGQ